MPHFRLLPLICLAATLTSCASYHLAQSVKLVSFVAEPKRSGSSEIMHGQDCRHEVFGIDLGMFPSADLAVRDAKVNRDPSSVRISTSSSPRSFDLRYINNFSLEQNSFDTFVYGRTCLIARGSGHL